MKPSAVILETGVPARVEGAGRSPDPGIGPVRWIAPEQSISRSVVQHLQWKRSVRRKR
jgi:hypothetical protein